MLWPRGRVAAWPQIKLLSGLATLLEGAGCIFMKVLTNFSFSFLFSVLLCCVAEDNVFKSCVNNQRGSIMCRYSTTNDLV